MLHIQDGEPSRGCKPFEQALAIYERLGEALYAERIKIALQQLACL